MTTEESPVRAAVDAVKRAEAATGQVATLAERRLRGYAPFAVAIDSARRFRDVDGRSRVAAITLDVFVALIPLTILLTAWLQPHTGTKSYGELLVRVFTLHGRTASAVRHALPPGGQSRNAASLVGVLWFVLAGLDLTNALQSTYDRAWRCASRKGIGAGVRGLVWLIMAAGFQLLLTLMGAAAGPASWGKAIWVTAAVIPVSLLFWLVTPGLLLSRRMHWRHLLPGAVVCTAGLVLLQALSSLFLPSTIDQYSRMLGQIGVAIALLFWVWLTSALWVVGAVLSAVMWERRTGGRAQDLTAPERRVPALRRRGGRGGQGAQRSGSGRPGTMET